MGKYIGFQTADSSDEVDDQESQMDRIINGD